MLQFIFSTLLFVSVGIILYMVVRTLPRIGETAPPPRTNILERWITSEIPEKWDKAFNAFLFKFLRRFKVSVLKLGNLVDRELTRVRPEERGGESEKKISDFKSIRETKEDTDSSGEA